MKKIMTALVFLGLVTQALAQEYTSTEDRSRFREQPYRAVEPGMLPPSEYIELAKKAIHAHYKDVHFNIFSDGVVTHRFYHNAPAADRDMICVTFLYQGKFSGGGLVGGGNIIMNTDPPIPAILAIIRKDRSKIYVNEIGYKPN
jgi:hypothetical protein